MAEGRPAVISVQPSGGLQHGFQTFTIDQETDWEVGLGECCRDPKWGCMGWWCPCCMICIASQRLGENQCYPCFFGPVGLSIRFRSLYRIRMSMCKEGCCWLWCPMCMGCRLMNEMDIRGCDRRN